jgi:hypothetical protein
MNVLSGEERDRLMTLRDKFHLPGRVTSCDATPMPGSGTDVAESIPLPEGVDESTIRSIAERVVAELRKH